MLLSESLGVTPSQLWKYGVFDSYLGIDSLLHVDPARLRSTRIPELLGGYKRFHDYFASILDMIAVAKPGDALERQAIKKLVFPEIREAALGYAETSDAGRGVFAPAARAFLAAVAEAAEFVRRRFDGEIRLAASSTPLKVLPVF